MINKCLFISLGALNQISVLKAVKTLRKLKLKDHHSLLLYTSPPVYFTLDPSSISSISFLSTINCRSNFQLQVENSIFTSKMGCTFCGNVLAFFSWGLTVFLHFLLLFFFFVVGSDGFIRFYHKSCAILNYKVARVFFAVRDKDEKMGLTFCSLLCCTSHWFMTARLALLSLCVCVLVVSVFCRLSAVAAFACRCASRAVLTFYSCRAYQQQMIEVTS